MPINICTNRKELAIQRDGENVGSIFFDPTDFSIIKRIREVQKKLADIKTDFPVPESGDIDKALEEAGRVDAELRSALDYAFDYPVSDVVFGKGFSFTVSKGVTVLEQFLNGALDYISSEMEAEAAASEARQNKYLSKYQTK